MDKAVIQQLITELELEIENNQRMIGWLKTRMEQGDSGNTISGSEVKAMISGSSGARLRFPRIIEPDAFFRMTVSDSIKKYLNIVKRPKTAKDIVEGLQQGGLTTKAKNLYATVYPTLLRMEEGGIVVRVTSTEWGLAEWYPGGRKNSQQSEEKEQTDNEG